MTALTLARLQFATTTIYHFFFVPLTLGLSILVALMETLYVRTGNGAYKRMAQFWGKLFLINFAMGVVTGLVQEFQFGMNWSEYSRFVGDIFGAPLAIEALLAFFLESTFLGIWIFGWEKLSKGLHAATFWLVAIGANLSALWILTANSFMQEPMGYVLRNGRAEMIDFGALLFNPHAWVQFPHVVAAGITTAAFFVLGISAYHLLKKAQDLDLFRRSFHMAVIYGVIGTLLVALIGHTQGQYMIRVQPMKMAAAEAVWESEDPASLSLFSLISQQQHRNLFSIEIPYALSVLAYNRFTGEVMGINELQAEYEAQYGPGNYVPPVAVCYWAFRAMVGLGIVMPLLAFFGLFLVFRGRQEQPRWYLSLLPWAILLPYLANTSGWLLTEMGRQPWIVYGLLKTEAGASPNVGPGTVLLSLLLFATVYAALMATDVYLLARTARQGAAASDETSAAY
jgi:cytochrome d ubiquinol oxidase subunit I